MDKGQLACSAGVWRTCLQASAFQEALKFGVQEGEACECCLVHGVDEVLIAVREAWLLIQELLVEVVIVSGGLLQAEGNEWELQSGPLRVPKFPRTMLPRP